MSNTRRILVAFGLVLGATGLGPWLAPASAAASDEVTLRIEGLVDNFEGVGDIVAIGDPFSITYTFDPTVPDTWDPVGYGIYDAVTAATVDFGPYTATGTTGTIYVQNDLMNGVQPTDGYHAQFFGLQGPNLNGLVADYAQIELQDYYGAAMSVPSEAIPTGPLDISGFPVRFIFMEFRDPDCPPDPPGSCPFRYINSTVVSWTLVDTTAPTVDTPVLSPATATSGAAVTVTADATDDVAVASAEVSVDGGSWTPLGAAQGSFGDPSVGLTGTVGAAGASEIAIGPLHGCVVLRDATMRCWGWNYFGQLGDGTSGVSANERRSAVEVASLSGVAGAGLGDHHTCAILTDTTVRCWGGNFAGQLGDGTTTDRLVPVAVTGLSGATALAVGGYHNCVILADTTVECWGWNSAGELGDGSTTNRHSPVPVPGLSGVTAIAAGFAFTCALLADTTVRCWGLNQSGQAGDGTTTTMYLAPVSVPGLSGVIAISAGYGHMCALLDVGTVTCWGSNQTGQVGNGSTIDQLSPVLVPGLSGVTAVVAANGGYHTCALREETTVWCWGSSASGALGDGVLTPVSLVPVAVSGLAGATEVGAGREYSCALLSDSTVRCWGYNGFGRLGDGTGVDRLSPARVADLPGDLATGTHDVCVRATDAAGNMSDGAACATLTIPAGPTPAGTMVHVTFADGTGAASPVSATFGEVTAPGSSSAAVGPSGPTPPATFVLGDPATYYELSTTATFTDATVCIDFSGVAYTDPAQLHLLHFEGGAWVDVTTALDLANTTVCGRVTSFSPFVVAQLRYRFSGFLPPIDNQPVRNAAKAGSAIPIKFSLGGETGLDIFQAGYPKVEKVACDTLTPLDEIEEIVAAGKSGLSYHAASGRYTYVWKTDAKWAGTCRQLVIRLADGTEHRATFTFRK